MLALLLALGIGNLLAWARIGLPFVIVAIVAVFLGVYRWERSRLTRQK